nr:MAG TPA: helix-turn-helix domain protein [Caudoviricetes sp.]
MNKLTQNEFFKAVAENNITDEIIAFAKAKYDKVAETMAKKSEKDSLVTEGILKTLGNNGEPMTASKIAEKVDASTQKVSTILKTLREKGSVAVVDNRTPYLYALAEGVKVTE